MTQSIKDFAEVVQILRNNKIEIWADLGALLGFSRNNNLLKWEEDIDVGTLHRKEDFYRVKKDLEEHGWRLFDKYHGLAIQNKKTKIDIKYYKEKEDYVYAYFVVYRHKWILPYCDFVVWFMNGYPAEYKYETVLPLPKLKKIEKIIKLVPHILRQAIIGVVEEVYYKYGLTGYRINFPRSYILPLRVQLVNDFPFRIPSQPEKYLELIYGVNWKEPMKIIPGTDRYEDGSSRYLTQRVMERRPDLVEVAE
jgi:hypothetical protein